MKVQMRHFLAAVGPGVRNEPETAFRIRPAAFLLRQPGHQGHHPPEQPGIGLMAKVLRCLL